MPEACRNCQSTDIRQLELSLHVTRFFFWRNRAWPFNLWICVNCGLTDLYMPKKYLNWAKKSLPPAP